MLETLLLLTALCLTLSITALGIIVWKVSEMFKVDLTHYPEVKPKIHLSVQETPKEKAGSRVIRRSDEIIYAEEQARKG